MQKILTSKSFLTFFSACLIFTNASLYLDDKPLTDEQLRKKQEEYRASLLAMKKRDEEDSALLGDIQREPKQSRLRNYAKILPLDLEPDVIDLFDEIMHELSDLRSGIKDKLESELTAAIISKNVLNLTAAANIAARVYDIGTEYKAYELCQTSMLEYEMAFSHNIMPRIGLMDSDLAWLEVMVEWREQMYSDEQINGIGRGFFASLIGLALFQGKLLFSLALSGMSSLINKLQDNSKATFVEVCNERRKAMRARRNELIKKRQELIAIFKGIKNAFDYI